MCHGVDFGNDNVGLPHVLRNVKQNRLVYLDVCTDLHSSCYFRVNLHNEMSKDEAAGT